MKVWLLNTLLVFMFLGMVWAFLLFINWAIEPIREVYRYNKDIEDNKEEKK